jgi:hypothetical protein
MDVDAVVSILLEEHGNTKALEKALREQQNARRARSRKRFCILGCGRLGDRCATTGTFLYDRLRSIFCVLSVAAVLARLSKPTYDFRAVFESLGYNFLP